MSLRDITHQADIELGHADTEYVTALKDEQAELQHELRHLPPNSYCTKGGRQRRAAIQVRLARIKELLAK